MDSPEQRVPKRDESLPTVSSGQGFSTSRRGFLAGAASAPLAAGLLGGGLLGGEASARPSSAAADKGFSVESLLLTLDERAAGFVKSADGGEAYANVKVEEGELFDNKTIDLPPLYEDIVVQASSGMEPRFFDWIQATWKGSLDPRDGSIVTFDRDFKPQAQRFFKQAYITEVTFPALDASSKETAYLTLKLDPDTTDLETEPGRVDTPRPGKGKKWLCSNFRLEIDGIEGKGVNKIDSFTFKVTDPQGTPKIDFSNLKITLSEATSSSWYKWYNKFVIGGNTDMELSGKLVLLDPLLKELFSVDMEGLGIVRLSPVKMVSGAEAVLRVVAELYVERMFFNGPEV